MRTWWRDGPAGRVLDCFSILLLRRSPYRRLADSGNLLVPFSLLSLGAYIQAAGYVHWPSGSSFVAAGQFVALGLFTSLYWAALLVAGAEPVLLALIRAVEADPVVLHWAHERRGELRLICFLALAAPLLLHALASLALSDASVADLIVAPIFAAWSFLMLARAVGVVWRFSFTHSVFIAVGPGLMLLAGAVLLADLRVAGGVAAALAALAPLVAKDLRLRLAAWRQVSALIESGSEELPEIERVAALARRAGAAAQSERLLGHLADVGKEGDREAAALVVRLLTAAGRPLDALDVGIEAVESDGISGPGIYLAMSEASLRADDYENAAACAQEAVDRGAGAEALLCLALASFALGERGAGAEACHRIISLWHSSVDRSSPGSYREARALLRRYETLPE